MVIHGLRAMPVCTCRSGDGAHSSERLHVPLSDAKSAAKAGNGGGRLPSDPWRLPLGPFNPDC